MPARKTLSEKMIIDTLREILINEMSDAEIAAKCLGDHKHAETVSGIRRNPPGLTKDRVTGELHIMPSKRPRTWLRSSMPP
jgi:hypothetical protein